MAREGRPADTVRRPSRTPPRSRTPRWRNGTGCGHARWVARDRGGWHRAAVRSIAGPPTAWRTRMPESRAATAAAWPAGVGAVASWLLILREASGQARWGRAAKAVFGVGAIAAPISISRMAAVFNGGAVVRNDRDSC